MFRYTFIFLVLTVSTAFAFTPCPPVNINMVIQEPEGYNKPFEVLVKVSINTETVTQELLENDLEVKVFFPPALRNLKGELSWKGNSLEAINTKVLLFELTPTLIRPLTYDIGAVVLSGNSGERPLALYQRSIYIEENRGAVLDIDDFTVHFEEKPWLKNALGFSQMTLSYKGGERKSFPVINIDTYQEHKDIDKLFRQEEMPNKLYQLDWLTYKKLFFFPYLENEATEEVRYKKKKKIDYNLLLASGNEIAEGRVTSDATTDVEDGLVELVYDKSGDDSGDWEVLGTDQTGDAGHYNIYFDDSNINRLRIIVHLQNSWGDSTFHPSHSRYNVVDSVYEFESPDHYDFGVVNYGSTPTNYASASLAHKELFRVRDKTDTQADYVPPALGLYYPWSNACGIYFFDNILRIRSDCIYEAVAHEFGHYIHHKKVPDLSVGNTCPGGATCYCDNYHYPFLQGWADGFKDWIHNVNLETGGNVCDTVDILPNLDAQLMITAAFYDFYDSGDDSNNWHAGGHIEECQITMEDIIDAFSNESGCRSDRMDNYLTSLKALAGIDDADIDSVIMVNWLWEETLLASSQAGESQLPKLSGQTELLQNSPNPLNPFTSISFNVGGDKEQRIELQFLISEEGS